MNQGEYDGKIADLMEKINRLETENKQIETLSNELVKTKQELIETQRANAKLINSIPIEMAKEEPPTYEGEDKTAYLRDIAYRDIEKENGGKR